MMGGVNITNANPAVLHAIGHAYLHVTSHIEFPKEHLIGGKHKYEFAMTHILNMHEQRIGTYLH